jgi:tRNA A-37 threonylcarbamoyl transferase component Bud32
VTQQCPRCGKHLDDGVRYCPHDGTPLHETAATVERTPTGSHTTQKVQALALPVVVGNRYRLTELRGGGGMAKVYKATDVTLEREVAVKLISPELRAEPEFDARFQREARIASQLHDPHIVVVHDFGLDPTLGPYLVMEFLQGQSLRERLMTGPLPMKAGLQLSAQLMLALIHAHDRGIVHRDIKPDNIYLLNVSGVRLHVRVLDFGIARIYRSDEPAHSATLTHPGAVLGTPRYMSPEQLAGQPVDARSDLYSAAVVIHEALTGQLPYVSGKKLTELCPDASPVLQDLLDQCLRPNPNERPASAIEVYLRLQELGKASGILLLPPGAMDKLVASRQVHEPTVAYVPPAKTASPWTRRALLGLLAAGLLALSAWGIMALVQWVWPPGKGLLGVEVGNSRDAVVARMGTAPERAARGDPWKGEAPEALGYVLRPEDVAPKDAGRDNVDLLFWSGDEVCVVLNDSKVRGVVVHAPHKGQCPRGVRLNDSIERLKGAYPEEASSITPEPLRGAAAKAGAAKHVDVYRYDALGVGFEVQAGRVIGITLYPSKP